MSPLISLGIVAAVSVATIVFALASTRRISMSPQDYIVGGRGFGAVFLWVLLSGEIYTSFTFLGAAGWAYGYGAPAFYIIAYGTVGFILSYFLAPWVWRYAKERGLLTAPDFFRARFGSTALSSFVAVLQCAAAVPYITLQLSGLQLFLTIGGYGAVDAQAGAAIGFVLLLTFIFITGLRGTAWASIIKDGLVIAALVFAGVALPIQFFGSPAKMFDQLLIAHPNMLTLDGYTSSRGMLWFISTVLLAGIGFFMGPHSIAAIYSAKDENVLRRNAVFLPVYQLVLMLVFIAGFSALLIVPGLTGPSVDQSFMLVVQRYYPAWVLGFVAAAGSLCALVPSTGLVLSSASIIAKNVFGDLFGVAEHPAARLWLTRAMVLVIGLLALGLWLTYKKTLVDLLLIYYNGVAQLAPAFFLGCFWKRTTTLGVTVGLVAGVAVSLGLAAAVAAGVISSPLGINAGFDGLAVNTACVIAVSLLKKEQEPAPASS